MLYIVAKTKALISFVVTVNLICVFVFTYAKHWFSHDVAHLSVLNNNRSCGYLIVRKSLGLATT